MMALQKWDIFINEWAISVKSVILWFKFYDSVFEKLEEGKELQVKYGDIFFICESSLSIDTRLSHSFLRKHKGFSIFIINSCYFWWTIYKQEKNKNIEKLKKGREENKVAINTLLKQ